MTLFGPHGDFLLNNQSQVEPLLGDDGSETGLLWVAKDGLILQVMTELLMKPNQYRAMMFNSLLSMGSPPSMHLEEV